MTTYCKKCRTRTALNSPFCVPCTIAEIDHQHKMREELLDHDHDEDFHQRDEEPSERSIFEAEEARGINNGWA